MIKKLIYLLIIVLSTSCNKNPIPDTSILDEIPIKELSEIIKTDTISKKDYLRISFATMYDGIRKAIDSMTDAEKAEFIDYTYRQFFDDYYACWDDTLSYNEYSKKWASLYKKDIDKALQKIKEWENSTDYQVIISPFENNTNNDDFALSLHLDYYRERLDNSEWHKYCRFKGYHHSYDPCSKGSLGNIRKDWDIDQIIEDYCDDFNYVEESDWIHQKQEEYREQKYPKLYNFMNIAKKHDRQDKSNY